MIKFNNPFNYIMLNFIYLKCKLFHAIYKYESFNGNCVFLNYYPSDFVHFRKYSDSDKIFKTVLAEQIYFEEHLFSITQNRRG